MTKRYTYRHMIETGDGRTLDDGQPNTYITEERNRTWVTREKERRSEYWIREFTLYGYLRRGAPRKWTRIDSPLVGDWREGAFDAAGSAATSALSSGQDGAP
jgi:hypothetical protein